MKKAFTVIVVLLIFAIVGVAVAGIVVDEMTSKDLQAKLNSIAAPANSSVADSISKTGKIHHTGALEYYGAILVQSQQNLGQLRSYYNANKPAELNNIYVCALADYSSDPNLGDSFPPELRFSHHDAAPQNYYIVYTWGEGQMPFPMFDYRSYVG